VAVAQTSATPATEDVSVLDEQAHRGIPTATAKADYQIDEDQSISGALSWMKRGGPRRYTQENTSSAGTSLLSSTQRLSVGHDPEAEYDERLG
jgi:hypothetical protein